VSMAPDSSTTELLVVLAAVAAGVLLAVMWDRGACSPGRWPARCAP
jgi:hypothetical protein